MQEDCLYMQLERKIQTVKTDLSKMSERIKMFKKENDA